MADEVLLAELTPAPIAPPPATVVSVAVEKPKISLHHASRDNRTEIVEQWISFLKTDNSALSKKDSFGYAPVHYAAKFNRFKILVKLVEAGANPNARTREESLTPLHFAARYTPRIIDKQYQLQEDEASASGQAVEVGKLSTSAQSMQYLVNLRKGRRVKINAKAQYGVSPLHLACQRGNRAAVSVLLRSNEVIVNIKDDNKDTPLHEACLNGYEDIVENLLTRMKLEDPDNVDINPQNNESQTPLHLACREGQVEVVKTLLKHVGDLSQRTALTMTRDNEDNTALHLACESGIGEIAKILILNGADLLVSKIEDVSPMHIASRYGFIEVAEMLMQAGVDLVNISDIYNQTPLHYAAAHNQVDMINFLLDRQCDIAALDTESYTPLMIAASEGHQEAFNVLLRRGADIDDQNEDGKTIVHLVAEENHCSVLKYLLKNEKGRELISSTDSAYNTPLHLASMKGHSEAVEILLHASGVKVVAKNELNKTPAHLAASRGHVQVLEALVSHQKDCILDEDEDGNTPLHLASLNGYPRCVKILLNSQADFDARNAVLWTPLDCAASRGHEKVVEVLIEAGADVNPTDKQQTTPLHLAAQEGHLNVVQTLLEYNADVGKCSNGLNSLDMAIDNGHEDIALAIIRCKQWKSALRNTTSSTYREGTVTTPLRKLIRKMPEVAEVVFNLCSEGNDTKDGKIRPDSKDYQVTFNYEFLEDFRDEEETFFTRFSKKIWKSGASDVQSDSEEADEVASSEAEFLTKDKKKRDIFTSDEMKSSRHGFTTTWGPVGFQKRIHPLSIMVENNRTNLLKHPLVTSLLNLKWRTYGRTAYFANLFLYAIFVTFLTAFALVSLNPQSQTCVEVFNSTLRELNLAENETFSCDLSTNRQVFLYVGASIVILVAVVRLFFELFQFFSLKLYYLTDWVNWVEVVLFACSIIFAFVYLTECLCPTPWQWQVGCIAVFLAWIDLIIFIRKIPLTGIYVLMFVHIFYTFCKMIILTTLLIFAFSLAFYMAFFDPGMDFVRSSFATPGRAIIKTMTMTTGEFEFDSIFRQFPGGVEPESVPDEIPFPPVSYILWIIFLVLMPILLTNLLVGLAVDDIKGIQDAAVLRRLALQVELALSVEELLPHRLRRYYITEKRVIIPNRKLNIIEILRFNVFGSESSRFDSEENITNALHPQPTPIEHVQNQSRSLILSMQKMQNAITELTERNIAMEKVVLDMARKLEGASDKAKDKEDESDPAQSLM